MKELTMEEHETVTGGIAPLIIGIFGATFLWADANWSEIKRGAMDGWNDTTR